MSEEEKAAEGKAGEAEAEEEASPNTRRRNLRFATTTQQAMQGVVERRSEVESNATRVQAMRERKLANSQTHIHFGFEDVPWESATSAALKNVSAGSSDADARAALRQRNAEMKKALTKTHFTLGEEAPEYVSSSRLPEPSSDLSAYRGQLSTEAQLMVKKSNISFGNAAPAYSTTSHDTMCSTSEQRESAGPNMREEAKQLKQQLARHNFTFGEDATDYTTDYQSGYQSYSGAYESSNAEEMKELIRESRKCHFSLGNEETEYTSHARQMMAAGENFPRENISERREHNKALKKHLQRTNFIIGDDEDYM